MYCRKCGQEIPSDSLFCEHCGAAVERKDTSATTGGPAEEKPGPREEETRTRKKGIAPIVIVLAVIGILAVAGVLFWKLGSTGKTAGNENGVVADGGINILDDKDRLKEVTSSVLRIECYDRDGELYATGSGFVAFESDTIVTNYHVIEDRPYAIVARSEAGIEYPISSILGMNEAMDIAILKTERPTSLAPLEFSQKQAEKGDPVVAIGSPLGLMNTVSNGIVSSFTQIDQISVIQFTASISHGSSGGVLLNESGEVIGVTFASFAEGQNINLAIPIDYVIAFVERIRPEEHISVSDLYLTGDHELSIDDVLTHSDMLMGSTVTIEGVVSSAFEAEEDYIILFLTYPGGTIDGFIVGMSQSPSVPDWESLMAWFEAEERERNRAYDGEVLTVAIPRAAFPESVEAGDRITVSGKLMTYRDYRDTTGIILHLRNLELPILWIDSGI